MRLALIVVLVAGCGGGGGPGNQLLPPGKVPVGVPGPEAGVADAGQLVAPDAGAPDGPPAGGDIRYGDPPPDAAPADAETVPSCAAIGFIDEPGGLRDCSEPGTPISGRRTAGHQFSCAVCTTKAGASPQRMCLPKSDGTTPPWICVPSCGVCPVLLNCDRSPCVQIGLDAGAGG